MTIAMYRSKILLLANIHNISTPLASQANLTRIWGPLLNSVNESIKDRIIVTKPALLIIISIAIILRRTG
jgi:hypothetical protein